ncbi:MAG: membrane protein insertion efficiency factor YidD [Candidatus Kapaibacterium sp.]
MVKLVVLVLIIVCSHSMSNAQDAAILHRVADVQESISHTASPRGANFFRPDDTSELRLVLSGIVRAYQLLISSQDTDVCAYEPSCSRFGMLSMQRFGIVKGFLLTADRLTRCNGLTDSPHERNMITGKFIDPVSAYDAYLHDHR